MLPTAAPVLSQTSMKPCCWRCWCGPDREFIMHITDNNNKVNSHMEIMFPLTHNAFFFLFYSCTGSDASQASVHVRGELLCGSVRRLQHDHVCREPSRKRHRHHRHGVSDVISSFQICLKLRAFFITHIHVYMYFTAITVAT